MRSARVAVKHVQALSEYIGARHYFQGLEYKLNARLRLNVFYNVPNFTRTQKGSARLAVGSLPPSTLLPPLPPLLPDP